MQEKTLLKISLICALVGIVLLLFMTSNLSLDEKSIDKITLNDVERSVSVTGVVTKVSDREKVMFIEISQKAKIDALLFKKGNISLKEGDMVRIKGKVDEYEDKPQIIINEIVFIS